MIIVRISGGLGNQMFQYAAGLMLATRHGVPLKCDLGWFEGNQLHQGFELARVFGLTIEQPTEADYLRVLGWRGRRMVRPRLERRGLRWLRPQRYIAEPHFHYWHGLRNAPADVYLDGYWQSEKYFLDVSSNVREAFTFALPLTGRNEALVRKIQGCNSISLHVRRGDYVSDSNVSAVHGVCAPEYYRAAVEAMAKRVDNPHFFIFSDDPDWVKANLRIEWPCSFADQNQGMESFNDMRLMSLCKHHIIANSSFSWWGAWLKPSPEKWVVAPRRWFQGNPADTRDLYCESWEQL